MSGVFFRIFDVYVWKWSLLHTLGVVKTPDLNGQWRGHLRTSYDEHSKDHQVNLTINQSWTRIEFLLRTKSSRSHSLIAGILTKSLGCTQIVYQYQNDPHGDAVSTMNAHYGTTILNFDLKKTQLEGEYYSGRGRNNYGTITLERS